MAQRDHSLDSRISTAAMEEFLDKGYSGASLRKIAEKAGVTVGAIQIRYKSKDELFVSLLKPFLDETEAAFSRVRSDYYSAAGTDILPHIISSMRHESDTILRLIFDHYEAAELLLYRSTGSSLAGFYDALVQRKIDESLAFFRSLDYTGLSEDMLGLLISVQFDSYRRIIPSCRDRQSAERCMNTLMVYHFGGWSALFDSVKETHLNEQEERK